MKIASALFAVAVAGAVLFAFLYTGPICACAPDGQNLALYFDIQPMDDPAGARLKFLSKLPKGSAVEDVRGQFGRHFDQHCKQAGSIVNCAFDMDANLLGRVRGYQVDLVLDETGKKLSDVRFATYSR